MILKKIVAGFVIQTYENDICTGQEFLSGDDVVWENKNGDPANKPAVYVYEPMNMVQPIKKKE